MSPRTRTSPSEEGPGAVQRAGETPQRIAPTSDTGEDHRLPERIQRRRTAGYRHPQGTIHVTRPSKWANPYRVEDHGRAESVRLFHDYAVDRLTQDPDWLIPLRDARYLACWCRVDEECHGDVLLDLLGQLEQVAL